MSASRTRPFRNRLLIALSPADRALLEPGLAFGEFALRYVFERPNQAIKTAYFLDSGVASVVARANGNDNVEVGLIGREGFLGVPLLLSAGRSPHSTYAQAAGAGYSIPAAQLLQAAGASSTLRTLLLKFVHTYMVQTAQTALANGRAKLEARLARWILMAHDRIDGDALPLTHEFLSIMLGVRRAGVTVALRLIEERGLVTHRRGQVKVIDRKGLELVTNGSYGVPEAEYRRLIGAAAGGGGTTKA